MDGSPSKPRPEKASSLSIAQQLSPQCVQLLRDLQKDGGRISFSPEVAQIQNIIGRYVLIYDDESKINRAFLLAFLGEDGLKDFDQEIEALSKEDQQDYLYSIANSELVNAISETMSSIKLPQTPAEWEAAREEAAKWSEDERKVNEEQSAFFWCFYFSYFFNTLSLMVHGIKMTSLVPRAIAGDDDAFLKAVQIDRMLLLHHPYFRDRKARAQSEGETAFLSKLAYRESKPPLHSKIRYPGLYMLFGILESINWLDELSHDELLDICEGAGLDRYQNRIEDVTYLTKRLIEYRSWKKVSLSMQ